MPNCFPKKLYHFTFLPAVYVGFNFSISLLTFAITYLSDYSYHSGVKLYLIMALICISLIANNLEHLSCPSWPFVYTWTNVYSGHLFIFLIRLFFYVIDLGELCKCIKYLEQCLLYSKCEIILSISIMTSFKTMLVH